MSLGIVDEAGATQTGNVRRSNEDAYLIRTPLFMVADGMGGARAGEIASRMCAEAFAEVDLIRTPPADALRDTIRTANARILERSRTDPEAAGMGTTVTAALMDDDGKITFAHVGDSRAYLLRDGSLQRLSDDHSLVGELVRKGELSEFEAERHPQRSVITRALGTDDSVEVDTFSVGARDGDVVLLCSDGLNTMVPEATIATVLAEQEPAATIARNLVRAALAGGGEDNVTAMVFRVGKVDRHAEPDRAETGHILPQSMAAEDDGRAARGCGRCSRPYARGRARRRGRGRGARRPAREPLHRRRHRHRPRRRSTRASRSTCRSASTSITSSTSRPSATRRSPRASERRSSTTLCAATPAR